MEKWLDMDDGVTLFLRRWPSAQSTVGTPPRAVLNIAHGMSEHSARYERLARKLNGAGIEVWAADMRGHGRTAYDGVNDPAKGGLHGHVSDKNGADRVVADVAIINRAIRAEYPDAPLFLMGHSWGSFVAQGCVETFGDSLSGCVLSGTRGPDGLKIKAGIPLMSAIAFFHGGGRNGSRLARAVADGPYSRPFRPNRTSFDWLSRDNAEVDAYINDPMCGNLCTSGFYRDLMTLLNKIHKPENLAKIPKNLPFFVFSGSADPVGDMGESISALIHAYHEQGISDLEYVLYPDARHETLNETNREEVENSLLAWLLKHIDK